MVVLIVEFYCKWIFIIKASMMIMKTLSTANNNNNNNNNNDNNKSYDRESVVNNCRNCLVISKIFNFISDVHETWNKNRKLTFHVILLQQCFLTQSHLFVWMNKYHPFNMKSYSRSSWYLIVIFGLVKGYILSILCSLDTFVTLYIP